MRGHAGEEEVGIWHVRGPIRPWFHFGWDAIRTWIGRLKRDHGMNRGDEKAKGPSRIGSHEEQAREGSSTPVSETSVVQSLWRHETEEKEGGGEGTKATTDEGTESSI